MKKIICLILCLITCLTAFGCGGISLDMNLSKDTDPPWMTGYEQSVFSVVRKDANNKLLGEGELTITLDKDETLSEQYSKTYSVVTTDFSFTQNGKTDVITSRASFENQSVYASYVEKTVTLESEPSKSYSFTCDYKNNKKVDYLIGEDKTPVELSTSALLSAHSGAVYDNETLYYLARIFNADSQQYGNFALTNLYDCYLSSNVNTYSVYYRTTIDQYLTDTDFGVGKLQEWGISDTRLGTYKVSLSINGDMSGPPVELWYTDPDIKFGNNKKVLVKIMTTTYKIPGGALDYTTTYTLKSYTSSKN